MPNEPIPQTSDPTVAASPTVTPEKGEPLHQESVRPAHIQGNLGQKIQDPKRAQFLEGRSKTSAPPRPIGTADPLQAARDWFRPIFAATSAAGSDVTFERYLAAVQDLPLFAFEGRALASSGAALHQAMGSQVASADLGTRQQSASTGPETASDTLAGVSGLAEDRSHHSRSLSDPASGSSDPSAESTPVPHPLVQMAETRRPPAGTFDQREGGSLSGDVADVGYRARALLEGARLDPDALVALFSRDLPEALDRLDAQGAKRTDLTALLVRSLAQANAGPEMIGFLSPRMRGFLEPEIAGQRPTGDVLKATGMLGDLYTGRESRALSALGVAHYCETLDLLADLWSHERPAPTDVDQELVQVLEANTNNIATHLARAARERSAAVRQRLLTLSASIAGVVPVDPEPAWQELAALPVWRRLLDTFDGKWGALFKALEKYQVSHDSLGTAYAHALSGLAHLAREQSDRVAAGFFNAGVVLLRVRPRPRALGRAFLNAVGLYQASMLNNSVEAALNDGDGFDCAVNLFGALSDERDQKRFDLERVRYLSTLLTAAFSGRAPAFTRTTDIQRLMGSLQNLRLASAAAVDIDLESLRLESLAVAQFIVEIAEPVFGPHELKLDTLSGTARAIDWVFEGLRAIERRRVEGAMEPLDSEVQRFSGPFREASADPVAAFLSTWQTWRADGGPVVVSGWIEAEEWRRVLAGRNLPCSSLGAALRAYFKGEPK